MADVTYGSLWDALAAFGYEHRTENGHEVFRHPQGKLVAVFPRAAKGEGVRPIHLKIAESTLRDDELVDLDDYHFYLKHGKKRGEMIQKGDHLIWFGSGSDIPVVAASTEEDGTVIIKQKGTFSPCPVAQLRKVEKARQAS